MLPPLRLHAAIARAPRCFLMRSIRFRHFSPTPYARMLMPRVDKPPLFSDAAVTPRQRLPRYAQRRDAAAQRVRAAFRRRLLYLPRHFFFFFLPRYDGVAALQLARYMPSERYYDSVFSVAASAIRRAAAMPRQSARLFARFDAFDGALARSSARVARVIRGVPRVALIYATARHAGMLYAARRGELRRD